MKQVKIQSFLDIMSTHYNERFYKFYEPLLCCGCTVFFNSFHTNHLKCSRFVSQILVVIMGQIVLFFIEICSLLVMQENVA
jgi:hypothetical protein